MNRVALNLPPAAETIGALYPTKDQLAQRLAEKYATAKAIDGRQ